MLPLATIASSTSFSRRGARSEWLIGEWTKGPLIIPAKSTASTTKTMMPQDTGRAQQRAHECRTRLRRGSESHGHQLRYARFLHGHPVEHRSDAHRLLAVGDENKLRLHAHVFY